MLVRWDCYPVASLMYKMAIMGIDPGASTTGIGILHVDQEVIGYTTGVIDTNHGYHPYLPIDKFTALSYGISEYIRLYQPYVIGIESPFINFTRPGAVIPLAKANGAIEQVLTACSMSDRIHRFAPRAVKRFHGVIDHKDKESTRLAMLAYPIFANMGNITEHEVDALAVAYMLYRMMYNN